MMRRTYVSTYDKERIVKNLYAKRIMLIIHIEKLYIINIFKNSRMVNDKDIRKEQFC